MDYELTKLGSTLWEAVEPLRSWARAHVSKILTSREHFDEKDAGLTPPTPDAPLRCRPISMSGFTNTTSRGPRIEARDHAIGAFVYDMRIYTAVEVLFGMPYAEAVTVDDQRRPVADSTRLSLVEPDPSAHPARRLPPSRGSGVPACG